MSSPSAQSWTEIRVIVPAGWQELVGEVLALGPCTSVAFGRANLGTAPAPPGCEYVRTFVAERDDTPQLRASVERALAELAERSGAAELAGLGARFLRLPPEDYAKSWEKVWKPFRVGRMAVLRPGDARALRAGELVLRLEPGGVFGTGRHATTRLCLRALQELVRGGERVLDCGSGTGVLAVASALLGARHALGFDIDPNAEFAARELAEQNGVAPRCEFRTGGFECLGAADTDFDGVCANLYSDLVQRHALEIAQRTRRGGWFLFSGCPQAQAEPTIAAVERAGLAIEQRRERGNWIALLGRRAT